MTGIKRLQEEFGLRFGAVATCYRAPGRVNLIGEHTDYNDGYVLPVAIDRYVNVAVAARPQPVLRLHSVQFPQTVVVDLSQLRQQADIAHLPTWARYVAGVACVLRREGLAMAGADLLIDSDVPMGAGLSSSAALEVGVGIALTQTFGEKLPLPRLARLCQAAEHEFGGTHCGIMDQYASALGRRGHAILLDCRSLVHDWVPVAGLSGECRWLVCDTRVHHTHSGGEYNRRREECESAVDLLAPTMGIASLRDLTLEQLDSVKALLNPLILRRCRHVVTENARVLEAAAALRAGDAALFGRCMQQSHASLRDDYDVSCRELDLMVELAVRIGGAHGARMTGGGFGGCTVNLVPAGAVRNFAQTVSEHYQRATGISPQIHEFQVGDGAMLIGGDSA